MSLIIGWQEERGKLRGFCGIREGGASKLPSLLLHPETPVCAKVLATITCFPEVLATITCFLVTVSFGLQKFLHIKMHKIHNILLLIPLSI